VREKLYQFYGSGASLIAIVLRQPGCHWSDNLAQSFAAADRNRRRCFPISDAAVRERSCRLIEIKVEAAFDKLKTDPRFVSNLSALDLL